MAVETIMEKKQLSITELNNLWQKERWKEKNHNLNFYDWKSIRIEKKWEKYFPFNNCPHCQKHISVYLISSDHIAITKKKEGFLP
jgi:hypothetical protein